MKSLVVWLFACILQLVAAQQLQNFQENPYSHRRILDNSGRYILEWLVDWNNSRVNFTVHVRTQGYVGLGLALDSKMEGADIVIGGVLQNGEIYFGDYHAVGNQQPVLDERQDWTLHSATETNNLTSLSFSRSFDTCDLQDIPIGDDTIYLLWAFGERDNITEFHHQNRGTVPIYLRDPDLTPTIIHTSNEISSANNSGPNFPVENIGNATRWAVREQFQIPGKRTTYWCSVKKFSPPNPGKHHIIGYNVRINPEALENMHHMLFYRCRPPLGVNPAIFYEPFVDKLGQECYDLAELLGPIPTMFCTDLIIGHAIGGLPTFIPDHVGISIGETSAEEYYLLQVHYDNPSSRADINSDIQMDLYYTKNIRENDAGILSLGQHIPGSPSILLPPAEQNHRFYGHCSSTCTRKMLPTEGIKIVGGLLHTHTAGRRLRIKQYRNGRELPWIIKDDNYKFQFQPNRILREERTVLPGDQVSAECYYDTTQMNRTTVGGYATEQEMCKTFLLYYTKLEDYPVCRSEIVSGEYMRTYLAGLQNVTWDQSSLEYVATWPLHLTGRTISNISDSEFVNWDISFRNNLRRDHIVHPQVTVCPSLKEAMVSGLLGIEAPPDYVQYPVHIAEYQQPERCVLGRATSVV